MSRSQKPEAFRTPPFPPPMAAAVVLLTAVLVMLRAGAEVAVVTAMAAVPVALAAYCAARVFRGRSIRRQAAAMRRHLRESSGLLLDPVSP